MKETISAHYADNLKGKDIEKAQPFSNRMPENKYGLDEHKGHIWPWMDKDLESVP